MERSIRIGKDFNVRWSINKVVDGERQPYELAGKELVLQYRTPYGLKEATEWEVVGNTIVWTFRGKEQKALGSYELVLTENGGKDGMVTVDTCRAFKLVAHSCEETEGSGSDIVIEDVVLESEVAFAALRGPQGEQGPAGPSYDDTEIKGKLAELSEEIEGSYIIQPVVSDNRYLSSDGMWVNGNYSQLIDVSRVTGKHLSVDCIQYAFVVAYDEKGVTFVQDGGRITASLSHTLVPADANYLYVYWGNNDSANKVVVDEGETQSLEERLGETINTNLEKIEPLLQLVDNFTYSYSFLGEQDSNAILFEPIILSSEGDSLEVDVFTEMSGSTPSYTFSKKNTSTGIALGISSDFLGVRDVNDNWLCLEALPKSKSHKVLIEYKNGGIYIYADSSLIAQSSSQSEIRIDSFGNGANGSYGYWQGTINGITFNGVRYDLSKKATLNNVEKVEGDTSLLTPQESAQLSPRMLIRKTGDSIQVGYNIPSTKQYIVYNYAHRVKGFTANEYPSYYDNWGLIKPFVAEVGNGEFVRKASLFSEGEAEIAISVENKFVGGYAHGFDQIAEVDGARAFSLLVDCVKVGEGEDIPMKSCNKVVILQQSDLYKAYSNSEKWAVATKRWTLDNNGACLHCDLHITQDTNITIGYMGMFCVERHLNGLSNEPYLTNRIIKNNNPFKVYSAEDGWQNTELTTCDFNCSEITLCGQTERGFAVRVSDGTKLATSGMFVTYNSSSNTYNKVYCQVCENLSAKAGDIISNECYFIIM